MKNLIDYFTDEDIIKFLCKLRVKIAQSRNEKHILHQLTKAKKYNYHLNETNQPEFLNVLTAQLSDLLPSRRNWVKLGKVSRYTKDNVNLISSFDKNFYSLLKTVKRDMQNKPNLDYLLKLQDFIRSIQSDIRNNKIELGKPQIIPKPKLKVKKDLINSCRPISVFDLRDRIVLSLTNRYLTQLFDPFFLDCSYAFRSKKDLHSNRAISHHDCIKALLKYKKNSKAKKHWVVECDIKKFFDTVDHDILLHSFNNLLKEVNEISPIVEESVVRNIFNQYLNRYSFSRDILKLNDEPEFWAEFAFKGEFGWAKDELESEFEITSKTRIGVPQGGAVSGLISNILLHEVDKRMSELNVFYVRFCDDMLIISPYFNRAVEAKKVYLNCLSRVKLLAHDFDSAFVWSRSRQVYSGLISLSSFYKSKSKGPYRWSKIGKSINWISFVGYEISFDNEIRVRKRSLDKELRKQNELLTKIKKAISKKRRATSLSTIQTLTHKLIGMSIGRATLRNYSRSQSEMCWKSGFMMLSDSNHAKIQMKKLDRNRNRVLNEFTKFIFNQPNIKSSTANRNKQLVKYNGPFSYYYQIIKREN